MLSYGGLFTAASTFFMSRILENPEPRACGKINYVRMLHNLLLPIFRLLYTPVVGRGDIAPLLFRWDACAGG
jgi:hypothetical protein